MKPTNIRNVNDGLDGDMATSDFTAGHLLVKMVYRRAM
jgi:hypothetical protein